ncbi:MAG: multicopper oxidase domain-containing protein [Anaerolineales bacterium]
MTTSKFKWMRLLTVLVMGIMAFSPMAHFQSAKAQAPAATGIVCTTGPDFFLTAQEGYIMLPDMNTMYMWSYGGPSFQHPGPVLCVDQGDTVTVTLTNSLPYGLTTSMVFPGQENVQVSGSPVEPDLANNSLTNSVANGGSITYSFVANKPGTYIYESGTDPKTQVTMGLFGALVVRPSSGSDRVYNTADSQFTSSEEFLALLSEIDPYQHYAWGISASVGQSFDMSKYNARYWLINGRGFPDSIADNYAPWLPAQPYGAMARIYPQDASHPLPAVERFINVGTEEYPFHPHGQNGLVIGRDGNPLKGSGGEDLSFEKFAVNIGPGQTWDVTFSWHDAEDYNPTTHPVPVVEPDLVNIMVGMFYGGSPYLGVTETMPPGVSTLNQCGEYYIISHNHALFQLDAFGQTMSGPITYLRVDPPQPNNCP